MADVQELNINNSTYNIKAKSVVDTNSGSVKMWTGTKAQYEALVTAGTIDNDTLYNVTDDTQDPTKVRCRSIGEIVSSTIPIVDSGLHLLDGALINGSGIYSAFVDYIGDIYDTADKYSNVMTAGTLSDSNGVISGFSQSNYGVIPAFNPSNNTWEMQWKFTTPSTFAAGTLFYSGVGLIIQPNSSGKINFYITSQDSSSDYDIAGTSTSTGANLSTNTTYWLKLEFTGSAYIAYISTDGETFTEYDRFTSSLYKKSSTTSHIGLSSTSSAYSWGGSIDLNECYINVNGSRWWTGRQSIGFTDESVWQSSVTTYGVCGKFVYDSINNTVRLPKITGILEGTTDLTALGDLVQAGLPNITGYTSYVFSSSDVENGALSNTSNAISYGVAVATANTSKGRSLSLDASLSNSIYGNSSTVQPQTIKVLYYIVIATTTKTEIEVDIDEIATDLNGKADVDLTNITNTGYIKMADASMPSNTLESLTLGASGTIYTAPADGYVVFQCKTSDTAIAAISLRAQISSSDSSATILQRAYSYGSSSAYPCIYLPVRKGQAFQATYTSNTTSYIFRFVYAVGSESEAS